jgi:hypothetical protein
MKKESLKLFVAEGDQYTSQQIMNLIRIGDFKYDEVAFIGFGI